MGLIRDKGDALGAAGAVVLHFEADDGADLGEEALEGGRLVSIGEWYVLGRGAAYLEVLLGEFIVDVVYSELAASGVAGETLSQVSSRGGIVCLRGSYLEGSGE